MRSSAPSISPTVAQIPVHGTRAIAAIAAGRADVINLTLGEPDFDTPRHIAEAGIAAVRAGHTRYAPGAGLPQLREAAAAAVTVRCGGIVSAEQVVVTAGAVLGVFAALAALVPRGGRVLVPDPGWGCYVGQCVALGLEPVRYPLRPETGFEPDLETLDALAAESGASLMVINNPGNPTGAVWRRDAVEGCVELGRRHGLWVLADEVYDELTFDRDHVSTVPFGEGGVVTTFSFSKTYAMTGWRVGYLVGSPSVAAAATRVLEHVASSVGMPSQYAAFAALQGPPRCARPTGRGVTWQLGGWRKQACRARSRTALSTCWPTSRPPAPARPLSPASSHPSRPGSHALPGRHSGRAPPGCCGCRSLRRPRRSKRGSGASGKLCRTDAKGLADKVPAGSHVEETNFDRVRRVRSFDDVVRQLREAIYSGRIRPGQRLPGERQLSEEFGVGRPTLREALRSLEAGGIIEVRPGKGGGSYAVTPSESTVGDALAALVNLRGASLEDLAEFRLDFEGENASWAARRADAGDIAMLRSIVAEARAAADDPSTLREVAAIDVRWHEALARATKNRLRIGIALGIHEAVLRRHRAAVQPPDADEHVLTIPDDIEAITRAVATGDADSARRLMRAHIGTWNRRATGDATVVADDALSA